jgi:hypothetical protein
MNIHIAQQFFLKFSNVIFNENYSSDSQVVACVGTNGNIGDEWSVSIPGSFICWKISTTNKCVGNWKDSLVSVEERRFHARK